MTSSDSPLFSVVVVAGGTGRRFGGTLPKQFQPLAGAPILIHTLRRFDASPLVGEVILVLPGERVAWFSDSILAKFPVSRLTKVVAGGKTRRASALKGLREGDVSRFPFVAIHDGVRPFFDPRWLEQGAMLLTQVPAVVVGIPPTDTIKRVSGRSFVSSTLSRGSLVAVQTPQMFQADIILKVHTYAEREGWEASDDATLVEWAGYPVKIIEGSRWNIKITSPEDLKLGEVILREMEKEPLAAEGETP